MPSSGSTAFLATVATITVVAASYYFLFKKEKETEPEPEPEPSTKVFSDKAEVGKELCAHVAAAAKKAIAERGEFHLAVAGGSLLDALSGLVDHKDSVDFSKVVLSFANHKCLAPGHEKATVAKSKAKFADAAGITKFISPTETPKDGSDGSEEAAFYAKELEKAVPHVNGFPVHDIVLLGLGADGHVGSNHPMGPAVAETSKAVAGSPKEGEPSSITMTVEAINSARQVGVVVCGGSKGKKEAVKRAMIRPFEGPRGTFPAQLLKSPLFFLDKEAAADL